MSGKDNSRSKTSGIRPYDKTEWQRIALVMLTKKQTTPSELEAAHIALRRDDPELASKCREDALRRRKLASRKII